MRIRAYIHHKRAETCADCQDRFGINREACRIAMSDGVSQSIFPQWWAELLVDFYLSNGFIPQDDKDLKPLQEKWQRMLCDEIAQRKEDAKIDPARDPWRLENHQAEESGAAATLCGITLSGDEWTWESQGDTCIISVAPEHPLQFYSSQKGDFGYTPDYLDSFTPGRGKPCKGRVERNAIAVIVATDAISGLLYAHREDIAFIKARLEEVRSLENHESFVALVESWRNNHGMHDDDSTLVLIEDISNPGFDVLYEDRLEPIFPDVADAPETQLQHTDKAEKRIKLIKRRLKKGYCKSVNKRCQSSKLSTLLKKRHSK